jgi:hypothetical protein
LVLACLVAVMLSLPLTALGASPSPSRPASTDTRSPLEGPGFVGAPLAAILAVLGIAVLAVLVTLVYVRMTANSTQPPDAGD